MVFCAPRPSNGLRVSTTSSMPATSAGPNDLGAVQDPPTTAVRGNVDRGAWAARYPSTARVTLGGRSFHVLHNLAELDLDPAAAGIDVIVSGHSHRPKVETVDGVLYLNPGSAGPRRFSLPIALATVELAGDAIRPSILDVSPAGSRKAAS